MKPVVIFGLSGSGKTTLANWLAEHYGYKKIVTYTTRPKRKGEVNGVDYHFVTRNQFADLEESEKGGFFAEISTFTPNGIIHWYGTPKHSLDKSDNYVLVLNSEGIEKLIERHYNILPIYLNTPQEECLKRLQKRGDDISEIARRMAYDLPKISDLLIYLRTHDVEYFEFQNYDAQKEVIIDAISQIITTLPGQTRGAIDDG